MTNSTLTTGQLTPLLINQQLIPSFWSTLFDPGDATCLSPDKYGVSIYNVAAADPTHSAYKTLQYFSVNPMKGSGRADDNVTKYRNFLIEFDKIPLKEQMIVVNDLKMPFSTMTFSGNKSIHFIISLENPLPDRTVYDFVIQWIYNILAPYGVDTQTCNPSRFSRVPGGTNLKKDDKGNITLNAEQKMLKVLGRVKDEALEAWLLAHKEHQPVMSINERTIAEYDSPMPLMLSTWTVHLLDNGVYNGKRNAEFFKMAFDFIRCGFAYDDATAYVFEHAQHLGDFPTREIESAFGSAYKTYARRGDSADT